MTSRASWFRVYGHPMMLAAAVISTVQNLIAGWRDGFPDFEIFYASTAALRQGLDPYASVLERYGPNTNPPLVVWLMQPLSALPYGEAAAVWTLLATIAMLWSIQAIHRITGHGWLMLAVLLITQAGILPLRLGQIAWLLMPLGTCAWIADIEGRSLAAGLWLGVLIYVKPFYCILTVYLAWRRDWRAVAGSCISFTACVLAGLVAGVSAYRTWIGVLIHVQWQAHVINASARGMAARLFNPALVQPYPTYTLLADSKIMEQLTFWVLAILIATGTALTVVRSERDRQWAVLGISAILLSPLGWIYYLPITLGPVASTLIRHKRWKTAWLSGALLSSPYGLLTLGRYGAAGTPTIASIYFWGTIVLWLGCLASKSRET